MTAPTVAQRSFTPPSSLDPADAAVISGLGYDREVRLLREAIAEWIATASEEMQPQLRWQFLGRSKYFRPLTVFACARAVGVAMGVDDPPDEILRGAVAIELFHNVSLIVDDILDESAERRGVPTLHRRFGLLPALMAAGYIVAAGYRLSAGDALSVRLLSELLSRLGVAECLQWRLRREPLGVEDWRLIAGEDTGTMFEVCACMGTRGDHLRKFGRLLGMLYHGCDDVGDARGLAALGGGGDEDVRDGILTLPAALAIRDPRVRAAFGKRRPRAAELDEIALAIRQQVPDAETYLDSIAEEARAEAFSRAPHPEPLFALIDYTRQLSRR
jgi:geranylgeranyl pyrophosphate synthase